MYDVIIVGAGVIGCAIARELARTNLQIAVVDRCSDVSEGTSKANSGIVHAGFDATPGSLKVLYNVRGNPLVRQWAEELHVAYRNNTSLVLAFSEADLPGLQALAARGRQNGVTGLQLLSGDEALRREKAINPQTVGALLAETGGIVSPYGLTIALAEHAFVNGVEFLLDCEVQAIHTVRRQCILENSGTRQVAVNSDNRFALTTSRGVLETRAIVNAAGVFADWINNAISEDQFTITARRGEYWMLDKRVGAQFNATIFQLPTSRGKGVLVTPTVEQTLIIGPTSEDVEDKTDTRTTAAKLDEIRRVAARTWPGLPRDQFITSFAGLRAHCDRGDFIIGRSKDIPGLYNAAGIESPGLTAAPAIALDIAAMVASDFEASVRNDFCLPPPPIPVFHGEDLEVLAERIARDPQAGRIVCRCEQVSEAEIRASIRRPLGARTLDGVKRRTRANMGRCQGSFCTPRVLEILAEELNLDETAVTKFGGQSKILTGHLEEKP
ncbi:MAG: glycerol-3-phosphate dehydrogenase [Firmicutes bacterium]|nr:glycerol-3-phosphate dehydrogenase [Bacillota bacterium]